MWCHDINLQGLQSQYGSSQNALEETAGRNSWKNQLEVSNVRSHLASTHACYMHVCADECEWLCSAYRDSNAPDVDPLHHALSRGIS